MYEDRRLASITTIKTSAVKVEVKSPLALLAVFIFALCSPVYTVFMLSRVEIISLQEAQYSGGVICASTTGIIDAYIYQHYDHGFILNDVTTLDLQITRAGIDFKNVIYQGSQQYWANALAHPERYVTWVVVTPNDLIARRINIRSDTFNANFELVAMQSDGAMLFHLRGLPPLPNRAPMPQYSYPHYPCQ